MKDIEIVEVDEQQLPRRSRESAVAPGSLRDRSEAAATSAPRPLPGPLVVIAAGLTAILAAVLAVVALLAWHSSARTVTTTQTVAGPPVAVTADALGCPVTAACEVSPMPLPDSMSAIWRWNAGAVVGIGTVVFDERGTPVHSLVTVEVGTRYAASVKVKIGHGSSPTWRAEVIAVTITSHCVPHGARVANSVRTDARSTIRSVTVGGRPGCSVVVTGDLPAATLSRLAHAPDLQL